MKHLIASLLCGISLTACVPIPAPHFEKYGERNCGVMGCMSSPYLAQRLSGAVIGHSYAAVVAKIGPPQQSQQMGDQVMYAWARSTIDNVFGEMVCTETVTVRAGIVTNYHFNGNC